METEYCNICGKKCYGVHSNKINNNKKEIQKIVNILMSYDENMVNEIIKQIYEIRRVKGENV